MPKTKFQSVVFTLMMVFCMVFCMTVYTTALNAGGLSYGTFAAAIREMWAEYVIVFLLVFFLITQPAKCPQLFVTVVTQSFTVLMIVPVITLVAVFLHSGFTLEWFVQWITTAVRCFPMAFFLQVFYVGPFVRFVFRTIFPNREEKTEHEQAPAHSEA